MQNKMKAKNRQNIDKQMRGNDDGYRDNDHDDGNMFGRIPQIVIRDTLSQDDGDNLDGDGDSDHDDDDDDDRMIDIIHEHEQGFQMHQRGLHSPWAFFDPESNITNNTTHTNMHGDVDDHDRLMIGSHTTTARKDRSDIAMDFELDDMSRYDNYDNNGGMLEQSGRNTSSVLSPSTTTSNYYNNTRQNKNQRSVNITPLSGNIRSSNSNVSTGYGGGSNSNDDKYDDELPSGNCSVM